MEQWSDEATEQWSAGRPRPVKLFAKRTSLGLEPSRKNLAQFAPKYFPRRRPRYHLHETNLARLLVSGQTLRHKVSQLLIKRIRGPESLAQYNKCARYFSSIEIGFRHHPAIAHRRMLKQHCFNFRRRHREPFVLNHLLAAVQHIVKPVVISPHDVARKVPAIAK